MTSNIEEGKTGEGRSTKRLSIRMEPISVLEKEVGHLARRKKTPKEIARRRPGKPKPKTV